MTAAAAVSAAGAAGAAAVSVAGAALARIGDVLASTSTVQAVTRAPLPAKPPIGGPVWTVVVPALLLVVSIWGTWMLYRHFAGEK